MQYIVLAHVLEIGRSKAKSIATVRCRVVLCNYTSPWPPQGHRLKNPKTQKVGPTSLVRTQPQLGVLDYSSKRGVQTAGNPNPISF